jgi:hypothetical protein
MITGTSHFVSFEKAVSYYRDYGFDAADVRRKIDTGEIHVGKPTVKGGEVVSINSEGRYMVETPENTKFSILTKKQVKTFGPKAISGYGVGATITAKVRYDDDCGNGHNTFSITADVVTPASKRRNDIEAGGCLHEDIARVFPELAPFIKWHLVSSDGPMYYVANTLYHASERDHNRLLKGEKRQLVNGRTKEPVWELVAINPEGEEIPTYKLPKLVDAATIPTDVYKLEWRPCWTVGEGKARELDHARSTAVWPDATDEELTSPGLKERLEARLPKLMAEFREAIISLGLVY